MKVCRFLLIPPTVFILCCTTKHENSETNHQQDQAINVPLQVTFIDNLPENLQPKHFYLKDMPKPITRQVPNSKGKSYAIYNSKIGVVTANPGPPKKIFLPVLKDDKGKTILNHEGRPYVLGNGGKSDFTNFSSDDGLVSDAISGSLMDKKGNIWFATYMGASKYDGKTFTNFTSAHGLANSIIWCITEDKKGNIWFGTDGGLSKYDGRSFTNYTTGQGLIHNSIWSITEDKKGNFWIGTQGGGVSKFDGISFSSFTTEQGLANNTIKSITEDNDGNLWFGTQGGGVSKYDGKSFTNYTTAQGLASNTVWITYKDKSNNLWFGTQESGVSKYDGKTFTNYTTADGLAHNSVWCIAEDKTGNLWLGTAYGGVSRYDGKSFVTFTAAQGLANNSVYSIVEDKQGNLWFGTYGAGVTKYNGNAFTSFTKSYGLAHNVTWSITEDKSGNLWFATVDGISKFDGTSFTNFSIDQGLDDIVVYAVMEDKSGNLWFCLNGGGVSKYDGKSFTNFTTRQGLVSDVVFNALEDKKGNLWFGTEGNGISKYDGKSFTNYTIDQGLINNSILIITEDKNGNLWIGTNGGLSKYDGLSFTNFTTSNGLAGNTVWSITEDKKGNLWFATSEGLSVLSEQQAKKQASKNDSSGIQNIEAGSIFKSFTLQDGLSDDYVTQVLQLPDGKMAIGTNSGITLFTASEDLSTLIDVEIYNTSTGYPVKDVNVGLHSLFLDSKGILWAATGSDKTALVRFDYSSLHPQTLPPTLVIQSIKINEENICWYDLIEKRNVNAEALMGIDSLTTPAYVTEETLTFGKELTPSKRDSLRIHFSDIQFDSITPFYPLPQNLVLPYKNNSISFDFNAIETSRNFMVRYQYILEGYNKEWNPVTEKTTAIFGNINEGNYTFKVKASSPEGVWSEPVTYTFRVLPPWFRTWWAYVIYSFIFLFALRVFSMWRERRLRAEKEKLERIVVERTKELKSSQAQLIQSEKMASLGQLTAGIAHEIQNPLNFVNNFSEMNKELLAEMNEEIEKGNFNQAREIAKDVTENEEKINHHGKRADAIVKGMLQHSRTSSGVKEPTDINALADEYLRLAYHGLRAKDKSFNATMKTDFAPNIGMINIVPQDIGRVILNLITNAFYAVSSMPPLPPKGGETFVPTVTIKTRKLLPPLGGQRGERGSRVEISVSDNGPGIPQHILDKIFQPFFTTKPTGQGTGLGLSLSYDIVKAHGGELSVETMEGEGTTFIIHLPIGNQ